MHARELHEHARERGRVWRVRVHDGAGAETPVDRKMQVQLGGRRKRPVHHLAREIHDGHLVGLERVELCTGRRDRDQFAAAGADVAGAAQHKAAARQPTARVNDRDARHAQLVRATAAAVGRHARNVHDRGPERHRTGRGPDLTDYRDVRAQRADPAPAGAQVDGAVVQAHELTRRYGEGATAVDALRGVSLDVVHGQLVAVMGPSGSGKSTLMHTLAGLDQPTSGTVTIAGTEITRLDDAKLTLLRREHIGFVFQFFNLLPMLNLEENVLLPLSIADARPDREWLEELLTKTGLAPRRKHRPAELSGGEQQRVAIARALLTRPTILFADEPTGNLDSRTGGEILELLRDSSQSYGQTIVMVTHDARAASIADRIMFLADGLIVKELTDTSAGDVLAVMNTLQS